MVIKQLRNNRIICGLETLALIATLGCSEIQSPISPQPIQEKKHPETEITQKPPSTFKQGDFARVVWTSPDADEYYIQIDDKPQQRTDKTNLDISNLPVGAHRLLIRAISYEDDQELIDLTPEILVFLVKEPDIRVLAQYYFPLQEGSLSSLAYDGNHFVTLLMDPNNFHISILKFNRSMSDPSSTSLDGLFYSGIASDGEFYWTSRSHEIRQLDHNFEIMQAPVRFDDILFYNLAWDPVENKLWSNGYTSGNYRFFKHDPESLSIETSYLAPKEPLRGFTFHDRTLYSIDMYGKRIYQHRRSDMIVREKFSLPQSSSITLAGLASDGKSLCALAYDPFPALIEIKPNQKSAP